jgi:hypothetical protein
MPMPIDLRQAARSEAAKTIMPEASKSPGCPDPARDPTMQTDQKPSPRSLGQGCGQGTTCFLRNQSKRRRSPASCSGRTGHHGSTHRKRRHGAAQITIITSVAKLPQITLRRRSAQVAQVCLRSSVANVRRIPRLAREHFHAQVAQVRLRPWFAHVASVASISRRAHLTSFSHSVLQRVPHVIRW